MGLSYKRMTPLTNQFGLIKHRFLTFAIHGLISAASLWFVSCREDVAAISPTPVVGDTLADAYQDKIREQPYPKINNELYLNPSPLIVPQSMKTGERLLFELSDNPDFNGTNTIKSKVVEWCMFNPHRQLKTGIWYWRFMNTDKDGNAQSEWSHTYKFEVKENTPVFTTPPFSTFLEKMPDKYPRLYCFLDPYLDTARKNVTSHKEYNALISRATTAMTVDYSQTNPNEKAEELKTHIRSLYDAYHLTVKDIYKDRMHYLLKRLLAYPVSDQLLFASNFGTTDIALCYALLYDRLFQELTKEEQTAIENLLLRVLRKTVPQHIGQEENHIFDNHFWQKNMRVLFQCAFLLHGQPQYKEEMENYLEYYYELWTARAPASGFNRDGIWHNGTGYFTANTKTLFYMPMLMSYITKTNFLKHPWYTQAGQAISYVSPPNSQSSGFGDGSEKSNEPGRERQVVAFADFLARELKDTYAGWYASQCSDLLATDIEMRLYRMCATQSYESSLPVDAPKMVWHKDAGEVTMHSNLEQTENDRDLSFRSSIFGSGSHTTSSQNAFNLLYKGKAVYRSSGYYLNFSDTHNLMSYRHSRAHNTILVNGIGQPYSTKAYGNVTRALEGTHITYCLGDASKAYSGISDDPLWVEAFKAAGISQTPENGFGKTPLTKYRRHVLMLHPEGIVIIYDELESSEPVTYDWLLHSPEQLRINQEMKTISHENIKAGFTAVTQLYCNAPLEMSVTNQFTVPPTTVWDPAYPNQWHMTAKIPNVATTRVLAIIQTTPNSSSPQLIKKSGNALVIGNWNIEAQLAAGKPAALTIRNLSNSTVFSLGIDNLQLNGNSYVRQHAGSSVLYDTKTNTGVYEIQEAVDRLPISTRTVY